MDQLTQIAYRQKVRKPVLYWVAEINGVVVDVNNSIALLRHKWAARALYKAVR